MPPSFVHGGCRTTDPAKFFRYINDSDDLIGLCCSMCLSEWVERRFLPDGYNAREIITISGKNLILMKKPVVDESDYTVGPKVYDLGNLAKYLEEGRHIRYPWFAIFKHHAIVKRVERNDDGNDQVTLIHWHGGRGNSFDVKFKATVKMELMDIDNIEYIEILNYDPEVVRENFNELTLARATAWVGASGYNLLTNNCEHFAVYCKMGTHYSFQVSWCMGIAANYFRDELWAMTFMSTLVVDIIEYISVRRLDMATHPSTQRIGLGVVVAFQGVLLILDVINLFSERNNRNHNEMSFVRELWKRVYSRLEKVYYTGVVPTECNIILGAMVPAGTSALTALTLGIVVSNVICDPWGSHSLACSVVNTIARWSPYVHSDVEIKGIRHIKPGDHIVLLRWLLHPRCHMIVTEVQTSQLELKVIRFTYSNGVVEETIPFQKPVHKVLHSKPLEDSEVIANARESQRNGASRYNIVTFNCKHWAFLCKIGRIPWLP